MLKNKLKKLFNNFENMLFVDFSCMNCGKEIFDNYSFCLCENCLKKIEMINSPICKICGESVDQNLYCEACYNKNYKFDKNISLCYYNDISANIIKQFKYANKKYYAKYISKLLFNNIKLQNEINYITFVPATDKNYRERGYNQSEELAKEFSKLTDIPVLKLLGKNEGYKNQASLNQRDRVENLKNAFFVVEGNKNLIKGKNILIIDDVFTTGTTLSRCAEILKKYKPNLVITLTFAKTKFISHY